MASYKQLDGQARQITIVFLGLLLVLLCSCSFPDDTSNRQYFDSDLRGTWETTNYEQCENPPCLPSRISIEYDYLTITGNISLFGNLPRGVRLAGYSKDSFIYINAIDQQQPPIAIAYITWLEAGPYPKAKMLTLDGYEHFKRIDD